MSLKATFFFITILCFVFFFLTWSLCKFSQLLLLVLHNLSLKERKSFVSLTMSHSHSGPKICGCSKWEKKKKWFGTWVAKTAWNLWKSKETDNDVGKELHPILGWKSCKTPRYYHFYIYYSVTILCVYNCFYIWKKWQHILSILALWNCIYDCSHE